MIPIVYYLFAHNERERESMEQQQQEQQIRDNDDAIVHLGKQSKWKYSSRMAFQILFKRNGDEEEAINKIIVKQCYSIVLSIVSKERGGCI
jgi:hypothetical protein